MNDLNQISYFISRIESCISAAPVTLSIFFFISHSVISHRVLFIATNNVHVKFYSVIDRYIHCAIHYVCTHKYN